MKKLTVPDIMFATLSEDGQGMTQISAAQQLYRLVMFSQSPEGGFTVEDIRKRLPLGAKLEKANKTVLLEDAEFVILQEAFKAATWRGVSPNIIALADAIEGAEGA